MVCGRHLGLCASASIIAPFVPLKKMHKLDKRAQVVIQLEMSSIMSYTGITFLAVKPPGLTTKWKATA